LFRAGHDQSCLVTKSASFSATDLIENQTVTSDKSTPDRFGHEKKKSGQNRIRTLDSELQPQSLTKPSTQGGTQSYSDPDLAKVVTAWPTLSAGLKAAIVAIVQSK
jgi:hypothetical protein